MRLFVYEHNGNIITVSVSGRGFMSASTLETLTNIGAKLLFKVKGWDMSISKENLPTIAKVYGFREYCRTLLPKT